MVSIRKVYRRAGGLMTTVAAIGMAVIGFGTLLFVSTGRNVQSSSRAFVDSANSPIGGNGVAYADAVTTGDSSGDTDGGCDSGCGDSGSGCGGG